MGLSDEALDAAVRPQLQQWWPEAGVPLWRLLRVYRIPYAQVK